MICCALLPSRGRFNLLLRAITSLHNTADAENFEVRVKFDDDDKESLRKMEQLQAFGNVHAMVAPRLKGYGSIDHFCTVMADESKADWIWILNDDVTIIADSGVRWDQRLSEIPKKGFIVQPEVYQLNASRYVECEGGAFPIVPNGCWRDPGDMIEIPTPSDTHFDRLLRQINGWKTHFLEGITAYHDRKETVPE